MRLIACLWIVCGVAGCVGSLAGRLTLPERNSLARDQLVFHSDFPMAAHHRLFEELTAQRSDLIRRLDLPNSDEPIHVYLFESADRFDGFMRLHHPDLPDRRAFFIETDTQLRIYAQWGDRVAEDLRHETTHGYLHAVVREIPLWLDEGIAEFYEVPRGQRGLNRTHLDRLLVRIEHEHWQPNLKRLEQFPDTKDMSQDDYGEAWAWVHFLMESRPETLAILRGYLADLRRDGTAPPISDRLPSAVAQPDTALIEHIHHLSQGNW